MSSKTPEVVPYFDGGFDYNYIFRQFAGVDPVAWVDGKFIYR